ncbi:MAG TPA: hypothetical protein VJP77_09695, partial [Planctomycetota bacterium]|nr:hypothetical protein [Planctomycetota bacterium]
TAAGAVRVAGGALELVLPGAFVDGARYPLVLDPLIGTELAAGAGTFDDAEPDAAFDASTSRYLVVWKRRFSATSGAVRGQRLLTDGTLDGGTLFFASSGDVSRPQVADANHASRFAVAWSQSLAAGDEVRVQACDPTTGALSQALVVADGDAGTLSTPDVGGEVLKNPYKQVLVVWDRAGSGIQGAKVELDVTGDPVLLTTFGVAADVALFSQNDAPAISRTAGHSGLYAVAYLRRAPLIGGVRQVRVALVDRDGGLHQPGVDVTASTTDELPPDIDGGGFADARWVVVNAVDQAAASHALIATPLQLLPAGLVAGPSETLSTACESERAAVAWHPGKTYVAWEQDGLFFDNLVLRGLDPATCGTCESEAGVAILPAGTTTLGLVMASSGGNYDYSRGLLVWNEESPDAASTEQDVVGHLLDAFGANSTVQDLGGACGAPGVASAPFPPAIGNGFFQVLLTGASPAAPFAILNVAAPQVPFACGACAWVPFASTSVQPVVAGAAGRILPVPCDPTLVGGQVDVQWTVVTPLDAPCAAFPGVSVSNRLRLTVG